MSKFSKDNQPANRGRPKGAKNKRGQFSEKLSNEAIQKLEQAVAQGEQWAIIEVLKRVAPPLKAVTPDDSLDGRMLEAKIFEITELEERLAELERLANEKSN
jgi:D-serine dehydratase